MFKQTKYVWLLLLLPAWAQAVVSLPTNGLGEAAGIPSAGTLLPGAPFGTQDQDGGVQTVSMTTITITKNGETTVYRSEESEGSSVGVGALLPGLGLSASLGPIRGPLMPFRGIGVVSLGGLSSPGISNLSIGFLPVAGRSPFGPRSLFP